MDKSPEFIPIHKRRIMIAVAEKQTSLGEPVIQTALAERNWHLIGMTAKRLWAVPDAIVSRQGWVIDWFQLGEYVDPRRSIYARLDRSEPPGRRFRPKKVKYSKKARKLYAARRARAAEAQMLRDIGLI